MIPASEMAVQLRQTRAFIEADPETVVFTPAEESISDGAGGWTMKEGAPREPQTVRLIPTTTEDDVLMTPEGRRVDVEYTILGMPDTLFDRHDTFMWRGRKWRIDQIHQKPDYERKGDVVLDG